MYKDIKTGLTLWRNMTSPGRAAAGLLLAVAAGLGAVWAAAPALYARVREFRLETPAFSLNMSRDGVILALAALHILVSGIALKRIVYEAHDRNRDLFYALAVSKRAGFVCTALGQLHWYGLAAVVLLAVCHRCVAPPWLLIPGSALLFFGGFGLYYKMADSRVGKRRGRIFGGRAGAVSVSGAGDVSGRSAKAASARGHSAKGSFARSPRGELLRMTVRGMYRCRSLTAAKLALIAFIVCCGCYRMLGAGAFLLANAFLILMNDRYWRDESVNFRFFAGIGIPVSRYLCVHFAAGAGFNIAVPLLLFFGFTGNGAAAAAGLCLLLYLLVFWYLAQVYLSLAVGREWEALAALCGLGFLAAAALPPAGVLTMVWLWRKIKRKWEEEGCSR